MAPRIDSFLRLAADQRASDLHFHTGDTPMIRHDGELVALPFRALSPDETRRFLYESIPGGPKWRHTWRGAALLFLPPGRHRFLPVDRLQPQRPDGLGERLFHSV